MVFLIREEVEKGCLVEMDGCGGGRKSVFAVGGVGGAVAGIDKEIFSRG